MQNLPQMIKNQKLLKLYLKKLERENIDYLKEIFSDSMQFVDPVGNKLDKSGFIAAVQNLYDLFDDISVEEMNGDALGSEVETVTYSNGVVWTNIWNTFSAKGKYTDQKYLFHFTYHINGKTIRLSKKYSFLTPQFAKEMNAKAAATNTSPKVVITIDMAVNSEVFKRGCKSIYRKT